MRAVLLLGLSILAVPGLAQAHPGHLAAGLAGHDHWVAGAAIGAAVVLGAWAALKGKRKDDADDAPETDATPEPQEA